MFDSTRSNRKPVAAVRVLPVVGLAALGLGLQGAYAEDPEGQGFETLEEAQAEYETLRGEHEEAREECERRLNVANGQIEGLRFMLEQARHEASQCADGTATPEGDEEATRAASAGGMERGEPVEAAEVADRDERERAQGSASGEAVGEAEDAEGAADPWALVERLLALGAEETEQGIRLSLTQEELLFESGTAELPRGEVESLDQLATLLVEHPQLTARVEGHTDSAGPDALNRELSQQRADAVRDALIEHGVAPERVTAEGIGEARPVATNATREGRGQNRRVEIYLAR